MSARRRPIPDGMVVTLRHTSGAWLAVAECMGTRGQARGGELGTKLTERAIDAWWDLVDAACLNGARVKGRMS